MQQMLRLRPIATVGAAIAMLASVWTAAASAQSIEEIDELLIASEEPADGLALARNQVAAGSLLEGLATLDRVLAAEPEDRQARLLHARVLCEIDDKVGAAVEFDRLRQKDYDQAQWDAAQGACSANRAPGEPDE